MHGVDVAVFRWINGWTNDVAPFFDFLSEGNKIRWVQVVFGLMLLTFLIGGKETRKAAILLLISVGLSNVVSDGFKHAFDVLRPCSSPDVIPFYVPHGVHPLDSSGTVSAHAANMAAIAFVITYFFDWWGVIPIVVAFL